ncbi:MAG TPA: universal stress protein [Rhodobacteraceae bacterium]|nr:universal stress protein [Paracoccaceae bacterium]
MKKILLATDFSERSDRALRRASLLAREFGAALSIVHVVDDDQPRRIVDSERKAASTLLLEMQRTLRDSDGIACETRVVLADPFIGIARAAEEEAPDLLVIGPHRRRLLRDVFVGTTAERTIRAVSCPVLMVNAPPVGAYRQVMLSVDMSEGAEAATRTALDLGLAAQSELSFLHVYHAPAAGLAMSNTMPTEDRDSYLGEQRKEAERALAQFVKRTGVRSAHQLVRFGLHTPADEILDAARDAKADLVVVGTESRSGIAKFFLGSVAEAVLRAAECDVLAVPRAAG